ncbi:MAG: hypothetical protein OEY55_00325 [Acidimicrobiia bacterium]|nr:hypothetical protein [Acidimicrobiia bacterium]MDH5502960.1 hypothetical protein [Acidimicrobiia bacterium]
MATLGSVLLFVVGSVLVIATLISATRTVVLPRAAQSWLTGMIFGASGKLFRLLANERRSFEARDGVMALFTPITLVLMPLVWVVVVGAGYTAMFVAVGDYSWIEAFAVSGSSLLTLGFTPVASTLEHALAFSEAALGLGLVALLITFLPSLYASFAQRESMVTLMEVRAGTPPSAAEFLLRFHRIGWVEHLDQEWAAWERWFAEIQESHTTFPALNFLRSPQMGLSWVTAAGTALDAAALAQTSLAREPSPAGPIVIRAGFITLRRIADVFGIAYDPDPQYGDPIALTRAEFDEALDRLAEDGLPVVDDRDQAWLDFAGWRVNYETVMLEIAELIMAPYAPWVSDRSSLHRAPPKRIRWGARLSR